MKPQIQIRKSSLTYSNQELENVSPINSSPTKDILHFISADPGSGKTNYIIEEALEKSFKFGKNNLIAVTTRALVDSYVKRSKGKIIGIHTLNNMFNASSEIIDIFNNAEANSKISLCITQSMFKSISKHLHFNANLWNLWIDEPKDPQEIKNYKINDFDKSIIGTFIDLSPTYTDKIFIVPTPSKHKIMDKKLVSNIKCNTLTLKPKNFVVNDNYETTEMSTKFSILKNMINNESIDVLINLDDYFCKSSKQSFLSYSTFILPIIYSKFNRTTFIKAKFEHSFLYLQYEKLGVKWKEIVIPSLIKMPTDRIRIHYLYENDNVQNSKNFRLKDNNLSKFINNLNKNITNHCLVVANNDCNTSSLNDNFKRISQECHGLNDYMEFTNIALISSYLVNKRNESLFNHYGTSISDVITSRQLQMWFQQVCRTDIRNFSSKKIIHVYVMTKNDAIALSMYFPDCEIVGGETGKIGKLDPKFFNKQNDLIIPDNTNDFFYSEKTGIKSYLTSINLDNFNYKLKGNEKYTGNKILKFITELNKNISKPDNSEEFNDFKNEKLNWYTGAIFKENALQPTRSNCIGSRFLALDFDGTEFDFSDVSKILKNHEYLIYTTFSDNPSSNIRYFRVIIPYNKNVSLFEHAKIKEIIFKKFEEYASVKELNLNIDKPKSNPYVKLYAPHKEAITKHIKRKGERLTKILDVDKMLEDLPKQAKILSPILEDIIWKYEKTNDNNGIKKKLYSKMNEIQPGNKNHLIPSLANYVNLLPKSDQKYFDKKIELKLESNKHILDYRKLRK